MPTYLDYAASAPLRGEVIEYLKTALGEHGNAASTHRHGQAAKARLEEARERLAACFGCHPTEVIFTSGATEANNLAVKGLAQAARASYPARNLLLASPLEHHAVLDSLQALVDQEDFEVLWLKSDGDGVIDSAAFAAAISREHSRLALATCMLVNNETGVIGQVQPMAALAREHLVPFHSDLVAAAATVPFNFSELGVTSAAVTAHKIGGPIGIGALLVERKARLRAQQHGGGQERKLRSGTVDVLGATAFALAAELALAEREALASRMASFAKELIGFVKRAVPDVIVTAEAAPKAPHIVHFIFPGCSGDSLLFGLDMAGVSVATGSACQAGVSEPSHVLLGMGYSDSEARAGLRVSFGPETQPADIQRFTEVFPAAHRAALRAGVTL